MTATKRPIDNGQAELLQQQIAAVRAELRAEFEQLKASLRREVRTERLVVEHPTDGRELIRSDRFGDAITWRVQWALDSDPTATSAVMHSGDEQVARGGEASVYVTAGDDIQATMDSNVEFDDKGARRVKSSIRLSNEQLSAPVGPKATTFSDDKPYLYLSPDEGVTLRDSRADVRGRVRFEVPL
jgi:hypothetical protein